MRILALLMFLASSHGFSAIYQYPDIPIPDDLPESASPACQKSASTLVKCVKFYENRMQVKCEKGGGMPRKCKVISTSMSCPASYMNNYLLCEIRALQEAQREDDEDGDA